MDDRLARLAKAMDKFVADHKGDKACAFVVLLAENSQGNRDKLKALADKHKIAIPLTISPNGKDPGPYKLNKDVPLTVLVYTRKKVKANFAYAGEAPKDEAAQEKQIAPIVAAAEDMLKK